MAKSDIFNILILKTKTIHTSFPSLPPPFPEPPNWFDRILNLFSISFFFFWYRTFLPGLIFQAVRYHLGPLPKIKMKTVAKFLPPGLHLHLDCPLWFYLICCQQTFIAQSKQKMHKKKGFEESIHHLGHWSKRHYIEAWNTEAKIKKGFCLFASI